VGPLLSKAVAKDLPPWTEDQFLVALDHGFQRQAFDRVKNLLSALRDAKTAAQLWEMQGGLLEAVLWAQEYKSRSKRFLERSRRGKPVAEIPQSGSWELEHRIASRVERQIRSVGDCLAWKVLSCRRDVFFVLSQNENPGSSYGKAGLMAEADRADAHWSTGHFTLMNDLTQSVRIGDLIIFTPEGPKLSEVKAGDHHRREQRERIRRALQTLSRERPLDVGGKPHEIFNATTQLSTRMDCLSAALAQSKTSGFGSVVIEPGWLVMAASVFPVHRPDDEDVGQQSDKAKQDALVEPGQHVLQTIWSWHAWDYQDALVAGVPFGAFPLEPAQCAELTCGYSMYRVYLRSDVLDQEFRRVGFRTRWSLPTAGSSWKGTETVLEVYRRIGQGYRGMTISASGLRHCLYELVQPRRYAHVVREMFDWSTKPFPARAMGGKSRLQIGQSTMAFSNEKAVWFKKPKLKE